MRLGQVATNGGPRPHAATANIVQLDILRIAATAAVVWLHVSALVVLNTDSTPPQWWAGNIADAASRWCLPIFVMLSGALLLNDPRSFTATEFYARRASRLLLPLAFWTSVYLGYRYFHDHIGGADLFRDTLRGYPYYHLWFLYMIVGLYAVTPLLKTFVVNSNRATVTMTALMVFLITSIDRTLSLAMLSAHHLKDAPHTFLVLWLRFLPYFLAGYILIKWPRRISIALTMACALISCALLSVVTAYAHQKDWEDPYFAYDYLDPIVVFVSLVLFARISSTPVSCSPTTRRSLQSLASLTFGIYLVHPLWLNALQKVGLSGLTYPAVVCIPLTTVTAFALSAVTTAAIRATPVLRRVV